MTLAVSTISLGFQCTEPQIATIALGFYCPEVVVEDGARPGGGTSKLRAQILREDNELIQIVATLITSGRFFK